MWGRNTGGVGSAPDTLLGPEGSGFTSGDPRAGYGWLGLLSVTSSSVLELVAGEREGRPYVENYTVDASI